MNAKEIRIVDYEENAESVLMNIVKKHEAKISDWTKKSYGLLVDIEVSSKNRGALVQDINETSGFEMYQ